MAEKMDAYLSDPSRSEASGTAGREMVLGHYTWARVVEALQREIASP
jgi:glycosyltransferase involved in cell wall biosynthesis